MGPWIVTADSVDHANLAVACRVNGVTKQESNTKHMYFKVPRLFGGSRDLAEAHLRKSLTYNPQSTASHFFLAELLLDAGRTEEGRAELQKVLDAPLDPAWAPEDREFKEKARRARETAK